MSTLPSVADSGKSPPDPAPSYHPGFRVPANRPEVRRILQATFPKYRKRDVVVHVFSGPMTVNSYWDGGSKDVYHLVRLDNGQVATVPTSHPYFDRRQDGARCGILELRELPENTVLVRGGWFCGKPATVYIYCRPDGLAKQLEAPREQLPAPQAKALQIICGIKGGCRDDYFRSNGLGPYGPSNVFVRALAEKGLVKVNKAGSVAATTEGHNVRPAGYVV
jgi:hypothetical protein